MKHMKKSSDQDILSRVYIAAPCSVPWDSMEGDDRIRHCQQCKLNVYNVAELSSKEAANLIRNKEGRLCLKIFRRRDGTIITDNCPVGLRRIRNGLKAIAAAIIALVVAIGWMDSAQAQGLIGAPVEPRYGTSGMANYANYKPLPPQLGILLNTPLATAYFLTTLLFLFGFLVKNRATMFMTSIFIVLTVFATGFTARILHLL